MLKVEDDIMSVGDLSNNCIGGCFGKCYLNKSKRSKIVYFHHCIGVIFGLRVTIARACRTRIPH